MNMNSKQLENCVSQSKPEDEKPLLTKIQNYIASGDVFYSYEFFPPKDKIASVQRVNRLKNRKSGTPLFVDMTWHPPSFPQTITATSSIIMAGAAAQRCNLHSVLHISCCQMTKREASLVLRSAKTIGIKNVLALRGDLPSNWKPLRNGFCHSVDLVRHIRQEFGGYFTVFVAGYPNGHPEAPSYLHDLQYLKEKVDAGADAVITQMFFSALDFIEYVKDCRSMGINVPIIPGIMQIMSYSNLNRVAKMAGLSIPPAVRKAVLASPDPVTIKNYGIWFTLDLCQNLLREGKEVVPGFNFFTFNRDDVSYFILKLLGIEMGGLSKDLRWELTVKPRKLKTSTEQLLWHWGFRKFILKKSLLVYVDKIRTSKLRRIFSSFPLDHGPPSKNGAGSSALVYYGDAFYLVRLTSLPYIFKQIKKLQT